MESLRDVARRMIADFQIKRGRSLQRSERVQLEQVLEKALASEPDHKKVEEEWLEPAKPVKPFLTAKDQEWLKSMGVKLCENSDRG